MLLQNINISSSELPPIRVWSFCFFSRNQLSINHANRFPPSRAQSQIVILFLSQMRFVFSHISSTRTDSVNWWYIITGNSLERLEFIAAILLKGNGGSGAWLKRLKWLDICSFWAELFVQITVGLSPGNIMILISKPLRSSSIGKDKLSST